MRVKYKKPDDSDDDEIIVISDSDSNDNDLIHIEDDILPFDENIYPDAKLEALIDNIVALSDNELEDLIENIISLSEQELEEELVDNIVPLPSIFEQARNEEDDIDLVVVQLLEEKIYKARIDKLWFEFQNSVEQSRQMEKLAKMQNTCKAIPLKKSKKLDVTDNSLWNLFKHKASTRYTRKKRRENTEHQSKNEIQNKSGRELDQDSGYDGGDEAQSTSSSDPDTDDEARLSDLAETAAAAALAAAKVEVTAATVTEGKTEIGTKTTTTTTRKTTTAVSPPMVPQTTTAVKRRWSPILTRSCTGVIKRKKWGKGGYPVTD